MDIQGGNNPQKIMKKYITFRNLLRYMMFLFLIAFLYIIYWWFFSHDLFSTRRHWYWPPENHKTRFIDCKGNSAFFDDYNNMVLILTLPNHHKPKEQVFWMIQPISPRKATCYSLRGHVIDVHKNRNAFVVVDGCTGEELINCSIDKNDYLQWIKTLDQDRTPLEKLDILKASCEFFQISDKEFEKVVDIINQHDTSQEIEGTGFFRDFWKIRVLLIYGF